MHSRRIQPWKGVQGALPQGPLRVIEEGRGVPYVEPTFRMTNNTHAPRGTVHSCAKSRGGDPESHHRDILEESEQLIWETERFRINWMVLTSRGHLSNVSSHLCRQFRVPLFPGNPRRLSGLYQASVWRFLYPFVTQFDVIHLKGRSISAESALNTANGVQKASFRGGRGSPLGGSQRVRRR